MTTPTPTFLLALDESGQTAVRPADRRVTFAFGGVIIPGDSIPALRQIWINIRQNMFREDEAHLEMKAKDYIERVGSSLLATPNPPTRLKESIEAIWRAAGRDHGIAKLLASQIVFSVMCKDLRILPLVLLTDKNQTSKGFQKVSRKGVNLIDQASLLDFIIPQFAVFLNRHKGRGSVVIDDKGAENAEIAAAWSRARGQLSSPDVLASEIEFAISANSPEVQVADVFLGLLRYAYEADNVVAPGFQRLMDRAEEEFLTIQLV